MCLQNALQNIKTILITSAGNFKDMIDFFIVNSGNKFKPVKSKYNVIQFL